MPPSIPSSPPADPATVSPRLGEEIPFFCDRCGQPLRGRPVADCDQCRLPHLLCPQCGHHQPVRTIRPAFDPAIGRVSACFAAGMLVAKLGAFAFLGLMWFSIGRANGYRPGSWSQGVFEGILAPVEFPQAAAMAMAGAVTGFFGRLLLMCRRPGYAVGAALAFLMCSAFALGAMSVFWRQTPLRPFDAVHWKLTASCEAVIAGAVFIGALVAGVIWRAILTMLGRIWQQWVRAGTTL